MTFYRLAISALALASCAPPHRDLPAPINHISPLEYDLFAEVIRAANTEIFTPDSTLSFTCAPTHPSLACSRVIEQPDSIAWTGYITTNKHSFPIDSVELGRRGIRMVGSFTEAALDVCPPGAARFRISRAGFNRDSTEAVILVSEASGRGPFEGCGYRAGGNRRYKRLPGGLWTFVGYITFAQS